MKNSTLKYILPAVFLLISFFSCRKILDREPLSALTDKQIWESERAATAYLDTVYYDQMPCWPYGMANPGGCSRVYNNWFWDGWVKNWQFVNFGNGNGTDEAISPHRYSDKVLLGTATYDWLENYDNAAAGVKLNWAVNTYGDIRTCNNILDHIDQATFGQTAKNYIKAQAMFWRAWAYYKLVKDVGGVPLILKAQEAIADLTQVQQPRNKTSECVTQILKDLDDAIALLPDFWKGADLGRVDKGAAMAFKGRVLLFFASPLFHGLNGIASWQKAYDANLAAKNFLAGMGKGLYPVYGDIWNVELNKEQVMFRRFTYPDAYYAAPGNAPLRYSADDWDNDMPSLELVNAFPMKDGSRFIPSAATYPTLFQNRDDRFYASIYYNGAPVQFTPKMAAKNEYYWTYLTEPSFTPEGGVTGTLNRVVTDGNWIGQGMGELNGFFLKLKGVDRDAAMVEQSDVDWPEIRYAEVLMNYGEAANELGKTGEALQVLYDIRQRAGISAGTGNYGITAAGIDDIRKAYQDERFVEFAFEGKRWDDLRRWKKFDLLRGTQRHSLAITLKAGQTDPAPMDDINKVYNKFNYTVITTDKTNLSIPDKMYIYGLPFSFLSRNPKLQQNMLWGGTFDPFM
ncbi:RagB/SusD family nutrient uptake outer membrane protein [Chitinophaga sp. 22321]|uniref:RagB/SusD family nutrient uptake outer membrane protein n=1 Tax=Chitinophaga hostae TaxID=2831022 RepID=A0ABS5IXD6_9BACT|nr:RagB/SusD family nutrient uptake outer membrane protein [Chitinophaga hostae]MBS0027620.1 RagB/SusD family nutrient uptake outer membrane protein [Chitinophaga hostae]